MTVTAANPERTNRWLLIGAVVLALIAGLAVAIALSNAGSGGGGTKSTVAGADVKVLVAKERIAPNTKISAGMFRLDSVPLSALVTNPAAEEAAVVGKLTNSEILQGEQLSFSRLGSGDKVDPSLAPKIPDGKLGFPVSVDETGSVAGLLVPGDHVDIVFIAKEIRAGEASDVTRVETVLQNVTVLAFAQDAVASRPSTDANGTPIAATAVSGDVRRQDLKPNPGARTVTLALTPQQVQTIAALQDRGKLQLALRRLGDETDHTVDRTFLGTFGFLPTTPAARP